MPVYEFEDERGRRVELEMLAGEAPRCGDTLNHEGRRLRRVPSRLGGSVVPALVVNAVDLPPHIEGAESYGPGGTPRFTSQKAIDDFCAKHSDVGMEWTR